MTLTNRSGIHARSAAKIVELVQRHECKVVFTKGDRRAEADSILDLLTLSCPKGSSVMVECEGPGAAEAMADLAALFARKFDEE